MVILSKINQHLTMQSISYNMLKLLMFLFLLNSCSSVKETMSHLESKPLTIQNLAQINGEYQNQAENGTADFTSLWSTIFYNSNDYENWQDLTVRLEIQSENSIKAELRKDSTILETKLLKGKIHNGYYLLNKQTKAKMMVFILVWGFGTSSVKIGVTTNNDLILMRKSGGVGMIVAFPGFASDSKLYETKYKKIKE
ncbi:MAG: hypothetical protein ACK5MD_05165 [Flavobacteriales bacterium]